MKRQRLCYVRGYLRTITFLSASFSLGLWFLPDAVQPQSGTISDPAYQLLSQRVVANQTSFYVYLDQDSGFNHGFPSGFFASSKDNLMKTIHIDTGCIDDPHAANGCSTNPDALDRVHGTVMRISFAPQTPKNFAGVNIEEPENWGGLQTGTGYDLRGAHTVIFDVRSPDGATIQFGVGGCNTSFHTIPSTWTTMTIGLDSLSCTPDLSNVHIVFAIATNDMHAPNGGTVLLDNIRFDPVPTSHQSALGFPLGNQTFGVVPQQNTPIPPDQVLRNLTTIYESALTEVALLARRTAQDLVNARLIADSFDYALHHDSHGDALPVAPDGSVGLHDGYENGDLALFNSQQPPKAGQAGDVRLAGFTATVLCAPSGFCLVLDGATGGNNAFAILALVAAFEQFGDVRYLNDAVTIGQWIVGNLTDHLSTSYGGYFAGYFGLDTGMAGVLNKGKSTENNADIFAAFMALATVESQLSNSSAAASWTAAANVAGDFVMQMFDAAKGRFNAGTVPVGTAPQPGICPNGPQKGNDVINTCDFLDSNTFTTLALAGAPRYQKQIDWRRPIQYVLDKFAQTVTAGGQTFQGFDIVPTPVSGPNGVAWEFTGQTCVAMRYVDQLYADTRFESAADSCLAQIGHAQASAPFGDGQGMVASTLEGGDTLPPRQQCLDTPFQCIAERVGLAATTWAIFAEQKLNVFAVTFSGWAPLPGGGATLAGPAVAIFNGGPWAFVRGPNNRIYQNLLTASGWSGWGEVPGGGLTPSGPGATVFNNTLYLFVRGTDNRIYQNLLTASGWSGWSKVPGGGLTPSGPGATVFNNTLYLFVRGTNDRIYQNLLTAGSWSGWGEVPGGGGTLAGPAAAVFQNFLYLTVQGPNNRIYDNLLTSVGWTGWAEVPGGRTTPSGPVATVFNGELWYFIRGTDNRLYRNLLPASAASDWTGWVEVPGGGFTPSEPGAAATANTLYLMVRGTDNGIYLNRCR